MLIDCRNCRSFGDAIGIEGIYGKEIRHAGIETCKVVRIGIGYLDRVV